MALTCPNCGAADLPDEARVCGHCGTRLPDPAMAPASAPRVTAHESPALHRPLAPQHTPRRGRSRGLVVGLVLLGAAVTALVFVVLSQSESPDRVPPLGQATTAPIATTAPATPTTAASATTTAAAEDATTTTTPASPQLPALQGAMRRFITGVEVVEYDDLSKVNGVLDFGQPVVRSSDGAILAGEDFANVYTPGFWQSGDAMVFRFSYDPGTSLSFVLENSSTFAEPGYRRFGFRMGAEWKPDAVLTEHWDGENEITGFAPIGSMELTPDLAGTEYVALLALDQGGRFVLAVWQDGPTLTRVIDVREFGEEWQEPFGFYLSVESGTLALHEYWRVRFDEVG